jgi:hypothetical protein
MQIYLIRLSRPYLNLFISTAISFGVTTTCTYIREESTNIPPVVLFLHLQGLARGINLNEVISIDRYTERLTWQISSRLINEVMLFSDLHFPNVSIFLPFHTVQWIDKTKSLTCSDDMYITIVLDGLRIVGKL